MLKKALLGVALVALTAPALASGASRTWSLMPGVTYTREVRFTASGPIVLHIVRGPKPGGLYALRPVLSNNTLAGTERVSSMQARLSRYSTPVGVNGDLFGWTTGYPSGIVMQEGRVMTDPESARSSLAVGPDGILRIARLRFFGSWQPTGFPAHPFVNLNHPLEPDTGVAAFTSAWGPRTPAGSDVVEAVLTRVPRFAPDREVQVPILTRRRGGGRPIPAGGAVLQARGFWVNVLRREMPLGGSVKLRANLDPWWTGTRNAIGGGPLLVRSGRPIVNSTEAFNYDQLYGRHPRTAVGQLANGRLLFVVVDGRYPGSVGVKVSEMASHMVRLGAVRAMGFDSGGSSTIAFNGHVLNRPANGGLERWVSNALMLMYYGVYMAPLRQTVLSPNGDGIGDTMTLTAKVVRSSLVRARLIRPNGSVAWRLLQNRRAGGLLKPVGPVMLAQGRWVWSVEATDRQGRTSRMARSFIVNNTLGFMTFSTPRMRLTSGGGKLVTYFNLKRKSNIIVEVRTAGGLLVRHLANRNGVPPGRIAVVWDGRRDNRTLVSPGLFGIRVTAVNGLGRVTLERRIPVWRDG